MKMLNYERLSRIVKDIKPYRRTKNSKDTIDRYPLDWRKHGYKCFFVEKDANGDNEYHIAYQHEYNKAEITKAEYDELVAKRSWGVRDEGGGIYTKYVRGWHVLGIVRKDNTFEFTTETMHQGDRMFLTSNMGIYHSEVVSSVKHGGTIYREYERDEERSSSEYGWGTAWKDTIVIPLFKGQRINIETNRSVLNYEVRLPYVNRQRSKEVMAEYREPLQIAEMFFKTMTSEVFASEMQEVYKEVFGDDDPWANKEAVDKMLGYAETQIDKDIYKYMYALMMSNRILNSWNIGQNNQYYRNHTHFPLTYFQSARTKFIKTIKLCNHVLEDKVYSANELYPSNAWAVKIFVDGERVRAY